MPHAIPWLAPLVVDEALKNRLERTHAQLNTSLGTPIPKTTYVRMLLDRGIRTLENELDKQYPDKKTRSRRASKAR